MPTFDHYIQKIAGNRKALQSTFFLLAFIGLLFNFKYNILLQQIGRNPILYQEIDPVYWAFMIFKLPDVFVVTLSPLIDVCLIVSCIASIVWNKQNISPIIFFISHFIYFVLYNMMSGHHYTNIGLLIMSFPFVFYNRLKFASVFSACRFLFCFMLLSAGLWKIVRGNLLYPDQMHMMLVSGHINNFLTSDESIHFKIIEFFIAHKMYGHILWISTIVIEVIFFLGFITVKKDHVLLIAYLLFVIGGWFFLNTYNYENMLFLLVLTPVLSLVETLNQKSMLIREQVKQKRRH